MRGRLFYRLASLQANRHCMNVGPFNSTRVLVGDRGYGLEKSTPAVRDYFDHAHTGGIAGTDMGIGGQWIRPAQGHEYVTPVWRCHQKIGRGVLAGRSLERNSSGDSVGLCIDRPDEIAASVRHP